MTLPNDPTKREEYLKKLSEAKKGKHKGENNPNFGKYHSEETRKKISEANKGKPPWNKGKKTGKPSPLKGKHPSEETRKKMSEAQKGKPSPRKGKHHSEEARKKMSESAKGRSSWNKGKHHPEETRKKLSESRKGKFCGVNSSNWKGGISFEPYCIKFNNSFKERVRAFFDYECIECGIPQNGSKLSIHHVNFRKDSCCSEDAPRLFVPVCRSCHGKTQSKRKYWEEHFTEIINTYYGGKCYFTENEMEQRINI